MTTIKNNAPIKATTDLIGNTQTMTSDQILQKVGQLKQQLEVQKQKLQNVEGIDQFSMEMQAQHADTLAMIDAETTLLENYETFLKTGVYPDGTTQDFSAIQTALSERESGWNDTAGLMETKKFQSDKEKVGANYAGTILLENTSAYDPANPDLSNMMAFVAGDDVKSVQAKTVGKDIHVAVTSNDGSKKVYVLKNMAARPEDIVFYFGDAEGPIDFDASQVVRTSDGNWGAEFGETFGLIIYGTGANDRIVGSQGADVIMGSSGDDAIFGAGGDDRMFGDDFNEVGASGFGVNDGNDILNGGAGIDLVYAGGGNEDKVLDAKGDVVSEHENPGATELFDQPEPTSFLSLPTGVEAEYKNGVLIVDADDFPTDGNFSITMPEGYTMASAEPSSDDQALVITLAGFDANGDSHTVRVKINGFFDPHNAFNFTFHGNAQNNIIDFSQVIVPANISIDLQGGSGDDTIQAPRTKLDSLGVEADDLGQPSLSEKDTLKILKAKHNATNDNLMDWGIEASTAEGFAWEHMNTLDDMGAFNDQVFINAQGEIELVNADPNVQPERLNFSYPSGYNQAVAMQDGNDLLLIFISHTTDGTEQVVVRLKGIADDTQIYVGGTPVDRIGKKPVIDGGEGYDTIYSSLQSAEVSAEETVQGTYAFDYEMAIADNTTSAEDEAELADKLSKVQEDLTDKLQEKKDLEKNKANNPNYEDDLAELNADIAELTATEAQLDADFEALQKAKAGE